MNTPQQSPTLVSILYKWINKHFADEEAVLLLAIIVGGLLAILTFGAVLAPLIASLLFAYMLQGLVIKLNSRGMNNLVSVMLVYLLFVSAFAAVLLILLPLIWKQFGNLASEVPRMLESSHSALMLLPEKYPNLISTEQLVTINTQLTAEFANLGQRFVSTSVASLPNAFSILVYVIIVPILVFFLLKDNARMRSHVDGFVSADRPILRQVWNEMNDQLANYIRGKAVEILIVGSAAMISFQWLGLKYAVLLGVLVGLSVIIPYIGAVAVTVPVLLVGFFQWGLSSEFWILFAVYSVIQILDGNVLVPLLFSEAVNLHPVAIIMAVLIFGSLWGFWGVFFAIPLATLIKAVLRAWPTFDSAE